MSGHQLGFLQPTGNVSLFFPSFFKLADPFAHRELIAGPLIEVDSAEIVKSRSQPKPTSRDEDETNGRTRSLKKACGMRLPWK
jgi:hypothetical protein